MEKFLEDDGLASPPVGPWSQRKYELILYYAQEFATSMKRKWESRVYIDLFAGAGRSRIKELGKIVPASPILALTVKNPFDKYIFCEIDQENVFALKERISRDFPKMNVSIVFGDANDCINEIISLIPRYSKEFRVLIFCLVDIFNSDNLDFNTIRKLSQFFVDFLILIPLMDLNRNEMHYYKAENPRMDRFLGNPDWRNAYDNSRSPNCSFGNFITEYFDNQMHTLGYFKTSWQDKAIVRYERKGPLYCLSFFSRNKFALKLWREALHRTDPQLLLIREE